MSLLSQIFQQQQQIAQNPTSVIRTPQQVAYDNLLNRETEINKQNKRNNFISGLMTGIGGLGKIIANSAVSQPMLKAGAMAGIGEQEQRLDGLRQAYDQARQQQNQDYVAQAKEQLGLAKADEDKAYNRDLTEQQIAYKKMIDDRNFNNLQEQQDIANKRAEAEAEERRKQRALDNAHRDRMYNLTLDNMKAEKEAEKQAVNKEEQKNVTEMQKSVSELQAQLNSFDKEIPELEQLNKESHMGAVGRTISGVGGGLGNLFGVKDNKFIEPELKNQEKVARLRQKALGMLKTTFGGAVSEGERDAIFAQFGLDKDNMNYKEYENAIKLMRAYFQNKLNEKQETLNLYTNQNSVNWE